MKKILFLFFSFALFSGESSSQTSLGGDDFAIGGDGFSADCMEPAVVDYDARKIGLADGALVNAWGNLGSGGAAWDLAQATTANKPIFRADCDNGVPCVEIVDSSDYLAMSGSTGALGAPILCAVIKATSSNDIVLQWSQDTATNLYNTITDRASTLQAYGGSGSTIPNSVVNGWNAFCVDITNVALPQSSVNGSLEASGSTLTAVDAPNFVTVGHAVPQPAGWKWVGGKIGRLLFYDSSTTSSLQELTTCLQKQWAF